MTVGIAAETANEVTIYVADNGVGIPDTKLEQVFGDSYTTGGTGLGLSIVEQIAHVHGWEVTATNHRGVASITAGGTSTATVRDEGDNETGACFEISNVSKLL